tara:strand:+ start:1119 stop:1547 length:429 start_codon:yes stop_codon:yes gene_type:complete
MYKFKEKIILDDVKKYIDDTYSSHYAHTQKQATEIIIDQGHGEGFCMGNILKYAQRYGKKNGKDKKDLMKVIHYAIIQLSQDHYKQSKSVFEGLQEDLLQYDIGQLGKYVPEQGTPNSTIPLNGENEPLKNVMSEKLNNPND